MMLSLGNMVGLPQASTVAASHDVFYTVIFWFSTVSLGGVTLAMIYFMIRYRRGKSDPDKTPYIEGHTISEVSICVVLFVIVMGIFYWGWVDYKHIITPPANSLEINVTARQWSWEFEYTNGRKLGNELVVPKGRPVRLLMGSADVLHSFYVPNFRLKQDIVPGAYTSLWFEAIEVGDHQIYCAEYCGTAHSKMLATLKVLEPDEYDRWQMQWEYGRKLGVGEAPASAAAGKSPDATATAPAAGEDMAGRGQRLYAEKGCNACHSTTGAAGVAPSFQGLYNNEREFADGSKTTADENYLRESMMDPQKRLVKGFPGIMPTFRGQLTDDEINALVAYIKSLKSP